MSRLIYGNIACIFKETMENGKMYMYVLCSSLLLVSYQVIRFRSHFLRSFLQTLVILWKLKWKCFANAYEPSGSPYLAERAVSRDRMSWALILSVRLTRRMLFRIHLVRMSALRDEINGDIFASSNGERFITRNTVATRIVMTHHRTSVVSRHHNSTNQK